MKEDEFLMKRRKVVWTKMKRCCWMNKIFFAKIAADTLSPLLARFCFPLFVLTDACLLTHLFAHPRKYLSHFASSVSLSHFVCLSVCLCLCVCVCVWKLQFGVYLQLGSSWWSVCCQSAMCVLPLSHSQTGRCRCTMTAVQSQRECDSKTRKALSEMTFRMLMALWMLMRRERRRVPACARGASAQCQCSFSFSLRPNFDRFCFSVVRLPFCCCCCLVCLCATVAAADQFKSLIFVVSQGTEWQTSSWRSWPEERGSPLFPFFSLSVWQLLMIEHIDWEWW